MNPGTFLRRLCLVLALAALFIWSLTRWVAIPWVVEGASMEPTLREGDCVIVDLWSYRSRLPASGEIVVARGPGELDLVKRIGNEPHGSDPYPEPALRRDPLEPAFILLGDNAAESGDSRAFGRVPVHRIFGRVVFRYWPLSRAGAIE